MNSRDVNMLSGSVFKNFIVYTVPIFITTILQLLFNAADLVVVGQFSGDIALAAVGASTSIYNVIIGLFMGISAGVDVISSFYFGMRDEKSVKKTR